MRFIVTYVYSLYINNRIFLIILVSKHDEIKLFDSMIYSVMIMLSVLFITMTKVRMISSNSPVNMREIWFRRYEQSSYGKKWFTQEGSNLPALWFCLDNHVFYISGILESWVVFIVSVFPPELVWCRLVLRKTDMTVWSVIASHLELLQCEQNLSCCSF